MPLDTQVETRLRGWGGLELGRHPHPGGMDWRESGRKETRNGWQTRSQGSKGFKVEDEISL